MNATIRYFVEKNQHLRLFFFLKKATNYVRNKVPMNGTVKSWPDKFNSLNCFFFL